MAFLTAQFKKLGLKPGNGESYLQTVPLVEITPAKPARLSFSGRDGLPHLTVGTDLVVRSPQEGAAVLLARSDLVFAGYGIVAPEFGWNDYAGLDAHGKTVLLLSGDPGIATRDAAVFKGKSLSYYGRYDYKFAEAARQGAAGVLLINDAAMTGLSWNAVVNSWGAPQLEPVAADAHAALPAVEGWMTREAGRALIAAAGLDVAALERAAARTGFKPVATGLKVDAALDDSVRRIESDNVIALLPGGERKHEYVMYCAHWDALGRDPAGALLRGARADASGVAGLLTLAQSFSRTRPAPQRSIAFLVFTGGESDRLGSRYYVEHPVLPLERTSAVLSLNRLHVGGRTRDVMIFDPGNSEIEEQVPGLALLQGREVRPDSRPETGRFYDSDALSFALRGVPAIDVQAGTDDAARGPEWGGRELQDYLEHRYRQAGDRYSDDWDLRGAVEDLELYRQIGIRLAETRRFPRWLPRSEFSGNRAQPLPED